MNHQCFLGPDRVARALKEGNLICHKTEPELNFRSRILKFRLPLQKPRSFEALVGYIVIIFIIFLIIFLIILTIFFNNIFSSFLAAFLYSNKSAKNRKKIILGRSISKNVKIMKKCSKNRVFSLFEYPNLRHRFSVGQMVQIYQNFG